MVCAITEVLKETSCAVAGILALHFCKFILQERAISQCHIISVLAKVTEEPVDYRQ